MTMHDKGMPDDDENGELDPTLNDLHQQTERLAVIADQLEGNADQPSRVGVERLTPNQPRLQALRLMAKYPDLALDARTWEANGDGEFTFNVLRQLRDLGLVDRPRARRYRINRAGLAAVEGESS